jgi:acyl-coenzyme A synthetase/AMP-(fatty) acid ligase/acyl carrier protein
VSVWEFLWPLMTGALLVVEEPGGHRDPRHLARTIEAEGVTVCHFVPSMLARFLDGAPPESLGSLRAVFASGEALPVETARRFLALGLDARLYNLYGPTEAAIDVSVWDCALPSAREGVLPIGRPIANLALHILDPDLQAVPVGVPGELHIGGVGLAAGYLGRPGLTADRFIPDPGGTPGARLYKTGDLARWLPDGSIEFLGRLDFQVKLRGLRIEIGEIEHHLAGLPGVGQCAVVVQKTPAGSDMLVAFIQPQGDPPPAEFLRRELKNFLPEYMIPARFEAIDGMPLNANGKLDRKRLAARPLSLAAESVDFATADATERTIQAIWRGVLQLERVGVEQNFFELGGNSLLMVQVHQALGAELGREIPLVKLFAHPTVRGLARYLDEPDDRTEQQERDIESTRQGRARLQRMRASRAKLEA